MAATPRPRDPNAPEELRVGDVVESCFRQKYVPWIVRECWRNVDSPGTQTVLVSHPGRGAARFTWDGDNPDNRYGIGPGARNPTRYYFVSRPDPTVAEAPMQPPEVMPLDVWRHKNGADYRVLFVANTHHESEKHPPVVVYETLRDLDLKCSRSLSDWHRSFTLLNRRA